MKVLLINPSGGYQHEYPPLGLLTMVAVLKDEKHQVAFFDEGSQYKRNISTVDFAKQFNPDVCGIALYTTNVSNTFETIVSLKKNLSDCIFIVGGPHATVLPKKTMSDCPDIDFLVFGEGEVTTKELLTALDRGSDISIIKGLCYRNAGKFFQNSPREMIKDLNSIPFPDYDTIKDFRYIFDGIHVGKKVATIMTSRGCPYDCSFCAAKAIWGRSFRRRSPENVVREIAWLTSELGYDEIYFMDDLFAVNRIWLEKFYSLMRQYGIDVPWKCLGRVDILFFQDYKKMAENGCYLIQFGVESADNKILKDINKNITTYQVRIAFNDAKRAGLNTYGFFIFGHQLDTYKTIMKTIYFAKYINPDFISFFCLVPFPGTKLYDLVPENLKYEWPRIMYSGWQRNLEPIEISSVNSKDLLAFERQAYVAIFTSIKYVWKNIICSTARRKLLRIKIWQFLANIKMRMQLIFKGAWTLRYYEKLDLTDLVESKAFMPIWNAWEGKDACECEKEINWHIQERRPLFDILTKHIKLSCAKNVLEVGCGTAIDSHYLSRIYNKTSFWALDSSFKGITIADKFGKLLGSPVRLIVGDMEFIQFKDGLFDVIFSQGAMEHFKNPLPTIKEQLRILKPGGYLIIDVPQKYNPYTLYKHKKLREGIWEYGWETEYSFKELKNIAYKFRLKVSAVGAYGYGYWQDYGLGVSLLMIRKLSNIKIPLISNMANLLLRIISILEKKYGHYFMLNIIVAYNKL